MELPKKPNVPEQRKKPLWKTAKFWIVFVIVLILLSAFSSEEPEIEVRTILETEAVGCEAKRIDDDTIDKGEERTETECEDGEKTIKYEIEVKGGKEISRQRISEEITKQPIDEIVRVGTKEFTSEPAAATNYYTQNSASPASTANSSSSTSSSTQTSQAAGTVHPGAYCSPEGATGYTKNGVPMACTKYSNEKQARWRQQ